VPLYLGCLGYGAAAGMLGVAFGTLVRGSAGSVAGILGYMILLPGLTGGVKVGDGYLSEWFFAEAGGSLTLAATAGDAARAGALLVGWVLVCAVPAFLRLRMRDA
jgi:ABC-2 type transport system permease protein